MARDLTAAEWAEYDRTCRGIVGAGHSCGNVRLVDVSRRVRREIEADPEAADRHGRAILYAEAMADAPEG